MPPVPRDRFVFAFELANSASELRMPAENPELQSTNIKSEGGTFARVMFRDRPTIRALFAAREHFGRESPFFTSFSMRYMALHELITGSHLGEWLKPCKEASGILMIHPAAVCAASEVMMMEQGGFPVEQFKDRARAIEKDEGIIFEI